MLLHVRMLVRKLFLSAVHSASLQMNCTTVSLVFHVPVMPGQFNQEVLEEHAPVMVQVIRVSCFIYDPSMYLILAYALLSFSIAFIAHATEDVRTSV